jgi:hypothetical protein
MIDKATPVQMRQSLNLVEKLKQAGIRFVPIPVANEEEYQAMLAELVSKLNQLERMAE